MENKKIPQHILEKIALGESTEQEKQQLQSDAETLTSKVMQLQQDNADFHKMHESALILKEIQRRSKIYAHHTESNQVKNKPNLLRFGYAFGSIAVLCLILFFVLPFAGKNTDNGVITFSSEETRLKGDASYLLVYRKNLQTTEILKDGALVKKGDRLQISYISNREAYGMIFSIDGRGNVTLHYPLDTKGSAQLQAKKEILLPQSYELDDAPGFERFFFISSVKTFSVENMLKDAQSFGKNPAEAATQLLKPGSGFEQKTILFKKEH